MEPPEDRCEFVLTPEEVYQRRTGVEEVEVEETGDGWKVGYLVDGDWERNTIDEQEWNTEYSAFSCWREAWDENRCVWHAQIEDKPAFELKRERTDNWERLDCAVLVGSMIQYEISFRDCSLELADCIGIDLHGTNLTDADLNRADLTHANLNRADLTHAHLPKADLTDAHLNRANLTHAHLPKADLTDANLVRIDITHAYLPEADLTNTNFRWADFTNADLTGVDLTDAYLRWADFTNANLNEANLTDAYLPEADLTDVDLQNTDLSNANLSGAILRGSDFEGTDLRGAVLTGADLRDVSLSNAHVNATTKFGRQTAAENEISSATGWNGMSRTYHSLKNFFSENGLTAKARQHHLLERDARRLEAREEGGVAGWSSYLGSWASRYLTGYGVSVKQILINIFVVLFFSTLGYAFFGVQSTKQSLSVEYLLDVFNSGASTALLWQTLFDSIYFSMITFTTVGYGVVGPETQAAKTIAIVEAFLGTVLIVLLGYVLGNRESI